MKKIYLFSLTLATALAISSCNKEEKPETNSGNNGDVYSSIEVPKENTALLVKFSGTKCPPCGGWGWTAFDEIMAANTGNSRFLVAFDQNFVSELYITTTAEDWKKALAINSWPTFVANNKKQTKMNGQYIDVDGTKANMATVASTHASSPVVVNSGFKKKVEGDVMTLNVKTKFFADADGEYYIGTYLAEDGIVGKQSGHPTPTAATHHHTLRQTGASYGEVLSTGAVAANTEFKKEVTINLDPSWNKDKLEVLIVIWKKVAGKYEFVNCAKAK